MILKWCTKQNVYVQLVIILLIVTACGPLATPVSPDAIPAAGTQLDFSPVINIDPSKIAEELKLRVSPFNGIFLSELNVDRGAAESWRAYYKNGEMRIAESDICLSNVDSEAGPLGGPLNVMVSKVNLDITIYTDYRYRYKISGLEIIVSSFVEQQPDSEIDYVTPSMPGAGGFAGPFRIVQTDRIFIKGDNQKNQEIDFPDFILKPTNGVRIFIPVLFLRAGDYKLIVKVKGDATPLYDDEKGDLTLTTGSKSYQWSKLDDPRKYTIKKNPDYPLDLVECP